MFTCQNLKDENQTLQRELITLEARYHRRSLNFVNDCLRWVLLSSCERKELLQAIPFDFPMETWSREGKAHGLYAVQC